MVQQNKAQDPLAAAMSAIEDALNLSHDDMFVDAPRPPQSPTPPPSPPKPPANAAVDQKPPAPAPMAEKPAPAPLRPAPPPAPSLKPAPVDTAEGRPVLAPAGAP